MSSPSTCPRCGRVAEVTPAGICADCSRSTDPPSSLTKLADLERGTQTFVTPNLSAAETGTFESRPAGGVAELESRRDLEEMRYLGEKGYRVERKLGAGGYGTVWLAVDAADRLVAVKVLHRYLASGLSQERFVTEAKVIAALKHDGLIELLHFDKLDHDPFLVMEYMPGGTLAERLKRGGPMPPREAAVFVGRVAEAVQYMHANKVYHRDLKPSNILIAADGSPKVSDLGLAKWEGKESLTPSEMMVGGTPEYGAPEQFRTGGKADARTDVYALGATLFCTLVGRPPFQRTPDSDLPKEIDRLLKSETPTPSSLNPAVSPEIEVVCLKALEKNPRDRYQTAGEFAAELGRIARGEPPVTRPPTRAQRVRRWADRHWKVLSALLAVFVVAAVAAAVWPEDALKKQRRTLAAGKPYTAIPEKGLPAYSQWLWGQTSLELNPDGVLSFQTVGISELMLVPDPMTDDYDFQADVRHDLDVDTRLPGLGLFVGYRYESPPGKDPAHSLIRVGYDEFPRPLFRGDPPEKTRFNVTRMVGYHRPNGAIDEGPYGLGNRVFDGQVRKPGPWRTIRIEARAHSLRVLWGTDPDRLEQVNHWTAADLAAAFAEQKRVLEQAGHDASYIETTWNPRRPLGVWASGSVAAFRNVTVTPKSVP